MGPVLNSSFLSMKQLGVLLLPPGWDASPSQGYPQHICWYPFVHLGEEKHCESKVSCLRTQHNDPRPGFKPRPPDQESSALTMRPYLQQERQIQFMRGRLQHITDTMQIHVLQLHFRA